MNVSKWLYVKQGVTEKKAHLQKKEKSQENICIFMNAAHYEGSDQVI